MWPYDTAAAPAPAAAAAAGTTTTRPYYTTFGFCLTDIFSREVPQSSPKCYPLLIGEAECSTGRMPLLSPK